MKYRTALMLLIPLTGYTAFDTTITMRCGSTTQMFPVKSQEAKALFVMSEKAVCKCAQRRWQGPNCDLGYQKKALKAEMDRKHQIIADQIIREAK